MMWFLKYPAHLDKKIMFRFEVSRKTWDKNTKVLLVSIGYFKVADTHI